MPKYIIEIIDFNSDEFREIANPDSLADAAIAIAALMQLPSTKQIRLTINQKGN